LIGPWYVVRDGDIIDVLEKATLDSKGWINYRKRISEHENAVAWKKDKEGCWHSLRSSDALNGHWVSFVTPPTCVKMADILQ
jgi:hypothetical protein